MPKAATSRAYAVRYEEKFDENADLVGLGLSNLDAGITGTFVINGSPTKTERVDRAGGTSRLAQIDAAGIVLAVLLFVAASLLPFQRSIGNNCVYHRDSPYPLQWYEKPPLGLSC